jgi:hypothetical protein
LQNTYIFSATWEARQSRLFRSRAQAQLFHIFHSFTPPETGGGGGYHHSIWTAQECFCVPDMIVPQTGKYFAIGVAAEGVDRKEVAKDFVRDGVDMRGGKAA